jgi:uncharacterized protein DUF262
MSGIRLQPYRIADLIGHIAEGNLALPEFQRDFDWTDDQVASLIATVIKRWPAGSLLLMEGRKELFFRERSFESGPKLQSEVDLIVLDGQQRLTGLFQAVYDTGQYVYAINLNALDVDTSVDEIEDSVIAVKRQEWDADFRDAPWTASGDGLIPLYSLRSTADYFSWRDATVRHAQLSERERDRLSIRLADAYRQSLESFHQYDLPAVIVERSVDPVAVARIFERVNTTGIPLGTFDLMVARTFKEGWNLRDQWDAALAKYELFPRFFGENGLPALQLVALCHGDGVRQSDVLRLDAKVVRKNWKETLEALNLAVTFLSEECGVHTPAWLPYPAILLTLAGVAIEEQDLRRHKRKLRSWFFSRTFGRRYEVAANTVAIEEVDVLLAALSEGRRLPSLRMSADIVDSASRRRQGAIWRGFICALAANGATNLHGGKLNLADLMAVNVLERRNTLGPGEESPHLLALGFILATRQEGRNLTMGGLESLQDFLLDLPERQRARVAKRQFLPLGATDEQEFLAERLELLSDFLLEVTGQELIWD